MADTKRWVPKVNRHVAVQVKKTVTNPLGQVITNYVKRRPGVITALATDTNPVIRVRHIGETYGTGSVGIARQFDCTVSVIPDGTGDSRTIQIPGTANRVVPITFVPKYVSL